MAIECGSDADSPTIMSEKNTPTDSTIPLFWNVARMPDAAPRFSAGELFMMPAMFGAANSPMPMPFISSSAAEDREREVGGEQHQQAEARGRDDHAAGGE